MPSARQTSRSRRCFSAIAIVSLSACGGGEGTGLTLATSLSEGSFSSGGMLRTFAAGGNGKGRALGLADQPTATAPATDTATVPATAPATDTATVPAIAPATDTVTVPTASSGGITVDTTQAPTPQPGVSSVMLSAPGAIPPLPGAGDWETGGAFRLLCNWSKMSNDDPIVYPGQPGAAHHHTFFGNTADRRVHDLRQHPIERQRHMPRRNGQPLRLLGPIDDRYGD